MKKILISIAAALVVLTILYLFVERRVVSFGFREAPEQRIPDLIGDTVDTEYVRTTGLIALRMKRRIEIEERKIDYVLQEIEEKDLLSGDIPPFREYTDRYEYCEKIVVTDGDRKILYSTDRNDPPGRVLEGEIYTRLVKAPSVSFVPIERYLVFSKTPLQSGDEPGVRVLFYYSYGLLRSLFEEIEGLDFRYFAVLKHDIVLLNFPDVDPGDEANADRLFSMVSEEDTGSVRIRFSGSDVAVYYTRVYAPYDGIIVGLAVETGEIGISTVGVVILISQTIVVLALLIFVFVSIGQKRTGPTGSKTLKPEEEEVTVAEQALSKLSVEDDADVPESIDHASEGSGVISLSDIEELTEVEEIGEAEIAGETELDDFGLPVTEGAQESPAEDKKQETNDELKPGEKKQAVEYVTRGDKVRKHTAGDVGKTENAGAKHNTKHDGTVMKDDGGAIEHIEDDVQALDSGIQIPDLGELVKGRIVEGYGTAGREAGVIRKQEKTGATSVLLKESEETGLETVVIPDEVFHKTEGLDTDDELSRLIDEMEVETKKDLDFGESPDLTDMLVRWLKNLSLSRGALLVRQKTGTYQTAVSVGLAESSKEKLKLEENEKFFRRFLSKGKLLYIREDAFLHEGMRDKFDIIDASKIQSLFFAPIPASAVEEGTVNRAIPGILVVCVTIGERTAPEIIAKEIKKIKGILLKYL